MIDHRLAWFAIGATCSAVVFGWPWRSRFSRFGRIVPRGTRSITFPDPAPDRQPINPFTGEPVKPQPHGGWIIRNDQWDPGWNYLNMSTGCQPRPQDGTPNPPSTDS